MNVRNCRKCGRVFNYIIGQTLCLACRDELESKFKEVKEYVQKNRGCTINDVAEVCEVETSQIKQWIREERLTFAEGSLDGIECEQCGALIRTGRFCDSCKAHIQNNLMSAIDKPKAVERKKPTHDKDRMRFLQN